MPIVTEEYRKKVLDDIKSYGGIVHPVKASLPERLFVRKVSLNKMHPNPDDEFSQEKIGPNYGIINRYEREFRRAVELHLPPIKEKLIIEKLSSDGYMLVNGHHRWYAATRIMEIKKAPVKIMNLSTDEEIISRVEASKRSLCVSFDLDEVLLENDSNIRKSEKPFSSFLLPRSVPLRKQTGALVNSLHRLDCDVWVYTGQYLSAFSIRNLFRLHGCRVDGIVNGMKTKNYSPEVREAFRRKYEYSIHIDRENVLCVNTRTGNYDSRELSGGIGWASEAFAAVKEMVAKA